MVFIIMGVSGCGKSTVGEKLTQQLELPFHVLRLLITATPEELVNEIIDALAAQ